MNHHKGFVLWMMVLFLQTRVFYRPKFVTIFHCQRTTDYVGGAERALAMRITKNSFWCRISLRSGNCKKTPKGGHSKMNDNRSLAHSKWNCKYHVVFAPKYRRKIFYGEKREEIGKVLRELCGWKQVILVPRILRWYSRKKQQENCRIHQNAARGR